MAPGSGAVACRRKVPAHARRAASAAPQALHRRPGAGGGAQGVRARWDGAQNLRGSREASRRTWRAARAGPWPGRCYSCAGELAVITGEDTRACAFVCMPMPLVCWAFEWMIRGPGTRLEETFMVDGQESCARCWNGRLDLRQLSHSGEMVSYRHVHHFLQAGCFALTWRPDPATVRPVGH